MTATVDFRQNVVADFTTSVSPTITSGPVDLYVDNINGSDSYPGTAALPLKTLHSAEARLPDIIAHRVIIRVLPYDAAVPNVGAYTWPTFRARLLRAPIIVVSEDFQTVSTGNVSQAGTDQLHVVSLGGLVVDEYVTTPTFIRITSGPANGDIKTIGENSVTDIHPDYPFTAVVAAGNTYDILRPLIRFTLPVVDGASVLAMGCQTDHNDTSPALFIVNCNLETTAAYVSIVDQPLLLYGVALLFSGTYNTLSTKAVLKAGKEDSRPTQLTEQNRTMLTYLPTLCPGIKSISGWGLSITKTVNLETPVGGFDGFAVTTATLAIRAVSWHGRKDYDARACIRGGRCAQLAIGATLRRAFLYILPFYISTDPYVPFKVRYAGAFPAITMQGGTGQILGTSIISSGVGRALHCEFPGAHVLIGYTTGSSGTGIGLTTEDGGIVEVNQTGVTFSGGAGDFSEDDGITIRAWATLVSGSYFRALTANLVTGAITGDGSLICMP